MESSVFQSAHFSVLSQVNGFLNPVSPDTHPTLVWQCKSVNGFNHYLDHGSTHFGFIFGSGVGIHRSVGGHKVEYPLHEGMYFCLPGPGSIVLNDRSAICVVISQLNSKGLFHLGGPVEEEGRLKYIDGCTDTLLIPPVKRGDPCLSHLHFPPGVVQTRHTHPSFRIGIVYRGSGVCIVPSQDDGGGDDVNIPLQPGMTFVIPAGGQHAFFTSEKSMDLISYHPDSDCGPTDDDHPMINRTIVDGVSAAEIPGIHTK